MKHKNQLHKKNGCFLWMFFLTSLLLSAPIFAQDSSLEYKIKAAYLYNFTKFISWPDNSSETFDLCILGNDPFGEIIDPIETRKVKNKPIRLYYLSSVTNVENCQIIYISQLNEDWNPLESVEDILIINSLKNTLIVSNSKKAQQINGMITFFLKDGKVKIQINMQAVNKSHLHISSKLLEVAEIVHGWAK